MKKYSFRLQSVLEVKLRLEEQAKAAFGLARSRQLAEEEKLERVTRRLEDTTAKLRSLVSESLDVLKIKHCREAAEILQEKRREQQMSVRRAAAQAELARKKLGEAMLERKTLERLRDKSWEEYMREYEADEQKQTDMLVSYTYGERIKRGGEYGEEG